MIGITLLMLLAANCVAALFVDSPHRKLEKQWDTIGAADAHTDKAWGMRHLRELLPNWLGLRWHPFRHWEMAPLDGETIHIEADGFRRTWNAPEPKGGPSPVEVAFFGASTTVGWGSHDDTTIPSLVAKGLAARGLSARVRNFGQWTYVNSQEMLLFIEQVKSGLRPAVVVFYDGCNELLGPPDDVELGPIFSFRMQREHALLSYERRWPALGIAILDLFRWSPLSSAIQQARQWKPPIDFVEKHTDKVIRNYAANVELLERLASSYGAEAWFFWQPLAYDKDVLTANEEKLSVPALDLAFWRGYTAAARTRVNAALAKSPHFVDLSLLLRDHKEPLYIDQCHVAEPANALIAEQLLTKLAPSVAAAAARRASAH
jgi:hypothetical protein